VGRKMDAEEAQDVSRKVAARDQPFAFGWATPICRTLQWQGRKRDKPHWSCEWIEGTLFVPCDSEPRNAN
jgi:hypothetical protein